MAAASVRSVGSFPAQPRHGSVDAVGWLFVGELVVVAQRLLQPEKLGLERSSQHLVAAFAVQIVHLLRDRKSTRLNSSHLVISYAVFCLKKKTNKQCDD